MNNMIKTSVILALCAAAGQLQAKDIPVLTIQKEAAIAVPAGLPLEQQRVEYIWPKPHQASAMVLEQQLSSDEYWETVTGAQLNKGISVYSSSNGLLRVAPLADNASGARQVAADLDMSQLQVVGAGEQSYARQLASQKQMNDAGFTDGSVALSLSNAQGEMLTLRTNQALKADAKYLVHIKEKNSPYKLAVSAANTMLGQQGERFAIDASVNGVKASAKATQASLISPQGQQTALRFQNGAVVMNQDLEVLGAYTGLYEVQLTTTVQVDGKLVKRSVKVPFANVAKTAQINPQGLTQSEAGFALPVSVSESGRYGITATLEGTNSAGKKVRLQTVDVAQWLSGNESVSLPFELEKFQQYSDLSLVDVKLMDQSRLMVVQFLPNMTMQQGTY